MTRTTDQVVYLLILAVLFVVDAVKTILTIRTKGIFIDQRQLLLQKTNKELRSMLVGIKRINNMRKKELVELVLAQA
tara:strand:+ start:9700 stop:9930 length:231 start_codon:yes stop_codon:yes gene_type:complete